MIRLLFFIVIMLLQLSCLKTASSSGGDHTASCLAWGSWRLISTTVTNQSSFRYIGKASDSVHITWKWANNGNFLLDSIFSYIGGSVKKYTTVFVLESGSATTALLQQYGYQDTLKCSPAWKPGLSNDILIKSISDDCSLVVFSIQSTDGTYYEIDSLRNIP